MKFKVDKRKYKLALKRVVNDALEGLGKELIEEIQKEIIRANAVATGNLLNSFKIERPRYNIVTIYSDCKYAKLINDGGKPKPIDMKKLKRWVEIKKKEFGAKRDEAAGRIYWKLKNRGIDERQFIEGAIIHLMRNKKGKGANLHLTVKGLNEEHYREWYEE